MLSNMGEVEAGNLLEIQKELEHRGSLRVELRGTGKSAFLYVRSLERAAEISIEQGGFFVEYWNNADEESDEAPIKSERLTSAAAAVNAMTNWLSQ